MTEPDQPLLAGGKRRRARFFLIGIAISGGVLFVLAANAHFAYVAVKSQPDCIPHVRTGESITGKGAFSAAKSAC